MNIRTARIISFILLVIMTIAMLFVSFATAGCGMSLGKPPAIQGNNRPSPPDQGTKVEQTMAVTGAIAIAGGVAACMVPAVGPAVGVPVAAGGAALLTLSLVLAKYKGLIALAGVCVLLGGLALVAWRKLRQYRTAFTEVVAGAQDLKEKMLGNRRNAANQILSEAQKTATTPKLVAAVKEKLPKVEKLA